MTALAGLPTRERQLWVELAEDHQRMAGIEYRIERLTRHVAGNCLDDCPCHEPR
jgi:hypothetical protein